MNSIAPLSSGPTPRGSGSAPSGTASTAAAISANSPHDAMVVRARQCAPPRAAHGTAAHRRAPYTPVSASRRCSLLRLRAANIPIIAAIHIVLNMMLAMLTYM